MSPLQAQAPRPAGNSLSLSTFFGDLRTPPTVEAAPRAAVVPLFLRGARARDGGADADLGARPVSRASVRLAALLLEELLSLA